MARKSLTTLRITPLTVRRFSSGIAKPPTGSIILSIRAAHTPREGCYGNESRSRFRFESNYRQHRDRNNRALHRQDFVEHNAVVESNDQAPVFGEQKCNAGFDEC